MIWILLAGVLGALIWYKCKQTSTYWERQGVKHTNPWPILGDHWVTTLRRKSFIDMMQRIYEMFPKTRYTGMFQRSIPALLIKDTELIKQITVKDFDHFTDHRAFINPDEDPLAGGMLFLLQGQRWREMRATLSGAFTSSKMKNMFYLMEETAENFVKFFLAKNEDLIEVEMKDTYTRYTNDVIATSAFGIQCDSLKQPNNEFYLMGRELTNFKNGFRIIKSLLYGLLPKFLKIYKMKMFGKEAANFFRKIISETIKIREEKGVVRPDMINLLLEARKGEKKNEEPEAIETGFATVTESTYNDFRNQTYLHARPRPTPDVNRIKQLINIAVPTSEKYRKQCYKKFISILKTVSKQLFYDTKLEKIYYTTFLGKVKQIKNITDDVITSQALIFFVAGFDTISTAMCFGSYELAVNKDIQDKLRAEIKKAYKKNNGEITYDMLMNVKYLDMVISEMLRMWSPVTIMDRMCTKPYTIEPVNPGEGPVHLQPGNLILFPFHAIHRDPAYYSNPNKFDPERFSDENKDSIKPYTYMPFGSGPRNCIGSRFALLEIKALLFNLLLNFEIVPSKKTKIPMIIEKIGQQPTAEGGFWFGLKRVKN